MKSNTNINATAVIIEDEALARTTLRGYLRKYFPQVKIVGELESVRQAQEFLSTRDADILFIDVQLKDGLGTEVLDKIESSKFKIVFTTAYEEFAMEAFKHKAFGYLLKPLDPLDFKEILARVLLDLSIQKEASRKIKVPITNGYTWLKVNEIIRCESLSNYTKIYCKGHSHTYTISKTLKYVESQLINSNIFVRVHQSHLINLNFLKNKEIRNNQVILFNNEVIPVSRSRKDELINAFNNLD